MHNCAVELALPPLLSNFFLLLLYLPLHRLLSFQIPAQTGTHGTDPTHGHPLVLLPLHDNGP